MNTRFIHEQLRYQLAEGLIHSTLVSEWESGHGLHAALIAPDGQVVTITAYRDYRRFADAGGWPPQVQQVVAKALHVPE